MNAQKLVMEMEKEMGKIQGTYPAAFNANRTASVRASDITAWKDVERTPCEVCGKDSFRTRDPPRMWKYRAMFERKIMSFLHVLGDTTMPQFAVIGGPRHETIVTHHANLIDGYIPTSSTASSIRAWRHLKERW